MIVEGLLSPLCKLKEAGLVRIGVSVLDQELRTLEPYLWEPSDYVITVCDECNGLPVFPSKEPTPLVLRESFLSDRKRRGATGRI